MTTLEIANQLVSEMMTSGKIFFKQCDCDTATGETIEEVNCFNCKQVISSFTSIVNELNNALPG